MSKLGLLVAVGTLASLTAVSHAQIVHQPGLNWDWPTGWDTRYERQVAGATFEQHAFRTRFANDAWLEGGERVAFGPFGLSAGFDVGPENAWQRTETIISYYSDGINEHLWGLFAGSAHVHASGYLGFRVAMNQPDSFLYGWFRIESTSSDPYWASFRITDYAYQSAPDTPIVAGAIPSPGAAALLAFAGLAAARRRR